MPRKAAESRIYAMPRPILAQSDLGPQIYSPHLLVAGKTRGRPAAKNRAVVNDVGAVGDAERLADVVVRDEHADAAIAQVKDDLLDVGDRDRIDPCEGLVEEHELRRHDERARDLRAPALAARQGVGRR